MAIQTAVWYITYDTYSREQTGNIIMLTQFEEGDLLSESHNLLSETQDDMESGNESDGESTLLLLISEE